MPKKKTEKILKRVNSSFTQKVAAISGMCMAGPRGVLVLPDAGAMVPWSTWPSSCGSFFFRFNLPFHPTIPLPQRHSPHCNSVGVSIGMMLPYPGRTSLHCLLWRSPRHPSIYIYKYIYVYHSSEDQAPHGAPWSRAPSPLACCQCCERPPARPVALCCRSWFGSVAVLVPSTSAPL